MTKGQRPRLRSLMVTVSTPARLSACVCVCVCSRVSVSLVIYEAEYTFRYCSTYIYLTRFVVPQYVGRAHDDARLLGGRRGLSSMERAVRAHVLQPGRVLAEHRGGASPGLWLRTPVRIAGILRSHTAHSFFFALVLMCGCLFCCCRSVCHFCAALGSGATMLSCVGLRTRVSSRVSTSCCSFWCAAGMALAGEMYCYLHSSRLDHDVYAAGYGLAMGSGVRSAAAAGACILF